MAAKPSDFIVGSRVLTGPGFVKKGEIKFIGTTQFADGEWIGIKLDLPEGKNDGTVGEVKYFDSDPLHGLFVRRAQVKMDAEVMSASASTREKLSLLKAKRSSMLKDNPATSSIPTMKASSSSTSVGSGSFYGTGVSATPRVSRIGSGLIPGTTARTTASATARTRTNAAPTAPTNTASNAAPSAPSTPPRATTTSSAAVAPAPVVKSSAAPVAVAATPAPVPSKRAVSVFTTPVNATSAPTAPLRAREPITATASASVQEEDEPGQGEKDADAEVEKEPTEVEKEAQEEEEAEDETRADALGAEESTVTEQDIGEPVAEAASSSVTQIDEEEEAVKDEDAIPAAEAMSPVESEMPPAAEPVESPTSTLQSAEKAVELATPPVVESAQEPVPAPGPEPAPAAPVSTPVATTTVVDTTTPAPTASEKGQALATATAPPATPVATTRPSIAAPAPAPTAAPPATPAPAVATPTVPVVASPQPSGPYSTPLRDASQRRLPPSRTNSMNSAEASAAAGGATPSKDSALLQFMQTSIYKLNQEKDELSDQIAALNIEVANLNAHLNDSSDLTSSMQEEIERTNIEKDAFQRQVKELQTQLEATKAQGDKEIATLQQRVKTLENTPPPKDPRLPELERQVAELSSMVESLTLDKEQLAVEQELLDEKYLQAQIDLEEALAEVQTLTALHEAQAAAAAAHGAARAGGTNNNTASAEEDGSGGEGGDGALALATLRAENEKLREALRRLNSVSVQDKQTLGTQTGRLSVLEKEVAELRVYKTQAESDLLTLRSTVDSVANYEDMIETLASKNMDLTEELAVAKETIRDLEDTVELNEEIDQQQRAQIDSDRAVIDTLSVTIAAHEAQVAEKDRTLQEHLAALGRIKAANVTLKAEIHRLNTLLSSEFQESKQMESKLKELASLRANQDILCAELHAAYQAHMVATSQKHKFQALYTRMDSIFGGTAVFIEESKLINTEIAFVSAATTGLEACKSLAGVLDVVLQCQSAEQPSAVLNWDLLPALLSTTNSAAEVKVVPTLGKLYVLLLQAQGHAVQSCVDLFKPHLASKSSTVAVAAPRNVQRLIDLKTRFESVAQLSSRLKSACCAVVQEWRAFCSNTASEQALLEAASEGEATAGTASSSNVPTAETAAGAFVPSDAAAQALWQLMAECAAAMHDLAEQMTPSAAGSAAHQETVDVLNIIQNFTLLASSPQVLPALKVETVYLSINTLCDVAISQLEQCDATADKDHHPSETTATVLKALKSMKVDVKASIMNLKNNTSHFVENLADLTGNYQLFVSCFVDVPAAGLVLNIDAASTEGMVKLVQNFIRKVNSAPGLSATVTSTQTLMLGMTGVTKYFPFNLLTNTVAGSDLELCARLREQFDQYGTKYWLLTTQTNSDLLVSAPAATAGQGPSTAGNAATGKKAVTDASASTASFAEVSWRQRVVDARNLISAKFDALDGTESGDAVEDATTGSSEAAGGNAGESPSKLTSGPHHAKLQAVLNELDIKRDELRAAMLRCEELQAQLDAHTEAAEAHEQSTASSASSTSGSKAKASAGRKRGSLMPTGPTKSSNPAQEVVELLKEVSTLEEALYATEQRAESLEQEAKLMKAQLSLQSTLLGDDGSADGFAKTRKRAGAGAGFASSGGAATNSVSLAAYQAALENNNYWKRLVLKRLTASLLPLAPQPVLPSSSVSVSVRAPANSSGSSSSDTVATDLSAQPKATSHPAALSFKHIELITSGLSSAPTNMTAAEYASIYHKIRLARAAGARIKSIDPSPESTTKGSGSASAASVRDRLKGRNTLLYRIATQ